MSVSIMNKYVAKIAENAMAQQNSATTGTSSGNEVDQRVENQRSAQNPYQDEAANYDLPKRTSDVAAWYQEFVLQEQEEKLEADEEETEKAEKRAADDEDDPVKKKLKEYEEVLKSLQRMLERMREARKKQQEEKKKNTGKLSYNYQKVSTAISSARTASQASNALTTASSNLSSLKRKAISGKYDERDIQNALQHAYKMIQVARRKIRNMRNEDMQQRKNNFVESQAKRQGNNVVHHAPQKQKVKLNAEIAKLQKELRSREKQKKNRHRREEDLELLQADLEYLKKRISQLQQQEATTVERETTPEGMVEAAAGQVSVEMEENAANAQESTGTEGSEAVVAETATAEAAAPVSGGFDVSI